MVAPFYTRCRVRVTYGDPIDLSAYYDRKRTRTLLRDVTDLLMRRLAELGGVAYAPDLPAAVQGRTTNQSDGVPRATG
jgi:hypothetical protein